MDAKKRKEYPMFSGVLRYFPDALMEVAHVSKKGNDQHNPGQPLHWAKEKSTDHPDALMRHLKDAGTRDDDGERHTAKVAWRALAMLQIEIENERKKPVSPAIAALYGVHDNVVNINGKIGKRKIMSDDEAYAALNELEYKDYKHEVDWLRDKD